MLEQHVQRLYEVMESGLRLAMQQRSVSEDGRPSSTELISESWLRLAARCGSLEVRYVEAGTRAESGIAIVLAGKVCCVFAPSTGFDGLFIRLFLPQIAFRVEEHLYGSMGLLQLPSPVTREDVQDAKRCWLAVKARRDDGKPEDWELLEKLAGDGHLQLSMATQHACGPEWSDIDLSQLGILFHKVRLEPVDSLSNVDPWLLERVADLLYSAWLKGQKAAYELRGGPYVSLYGFTGRFQYRVDDEPPTDMFVEMSNGRGANYDEIVAAGKPIYYALIRRVDFTPPTL